MKFEKVVTLSMAPYETLRLAVSEAESFEDCDRELMAEAKRIDDYVDQRVRSMIGKERSA